MKELLITEINRIHEIMGIKNSKVLILENTKNPFLEIWDTAFNFFKKYEPTTVSPNARVIRLGAIDVPRNTYTAIKTFLTTKNWDLLTPTNARNLGVILSQDTDFVNKIYQSQFRKALDTLKLTEKELIQKIKNDLPPNATTQDIQNYLANLFKNPNDPASEKPAELLSSFLEPKISSRIKDLDSGKFLPEIYNAEGFIRNTGKNLEPPVLKAFREILGGGIFVSTEKLEKRLDEILSKISQKLDSGVKVNREMRELFNTIVALKKSAGDNVRKLYDLHITNNPNIPKEFKDELEKEDYVKKILDYAQEDLVKSTWPILKQKGDAYFSSVPIIGWLYRAMIGGMKEEGKTLKNVLTEAAEGVKRTLNVIAWNSPLSMKEAVVNFSRTGKWATLGEKALGYIFLHSFLIPGILARLEGYYKNKKIRELNAQIQEVKEACEAGLIDCSDSDLQLLENYNKDMFWSDFYDNVPLLKIGREGFQASDLLFFTYIDEVSNLLMDADEEMAYGDQDVLDILKQRLTDIQNKTGQELKKVGIDPEKSEEIEQASKMLNQKYDNSETGFKQFIKNSVGADTTGINVKVPGENNTFTYWGDKYKWIRDGASTLGTFEVQNAQ